MHFIESSVGQMLRSRHEDRQDSKWGQQKNAGCSESSKSNRWAEYANPKLRKIQVCLELVHLKLRLSESSKFELNLPCAESMPESVPVTYVGDTRS